MNSFKGGTYPPKYKKTSEIAIEEIPLPKIAVVPLLQHVGSPSKPVVKAGDIVKTGQLIAEITGLISARIHSPISGKVLVIEKRLHPFGIGIESIIIESDEKDERVEFHPKDITKLFPNEIIDIIETTNDVLEKIEFLEIKEKCFKEVIKVRNSYKNFFLDNFKSMGNFNFDHSFFSYDVVVNEMSKSFNCIIGTSEY